MVVHDKHNPPPSERPPRRGKLKTATAETIEREISRAYERAKASGEKPPNVNAILVPVNASLAALGYYATRRQIMAVAMHEKHAGRRLPKGRRGPARDEQGCRAREKCGPTT